MPKRYVKLTGHRDRHENAVEVLLLKGGKEVRLGEPVDLTATEREGLEEKGYEFETSSKKELEEIAEAEVQPVGDDVAGADLSDSDFDYDQNEGGE